MVKLPKLDHIKYVRAKGRLYAYFNTGRKVNGKPIYIRLPDPSSPGFFDSYASAKGARTKRANVTYTIADMARDFENSVQFRGLARSSQDLYSKTLKRITSLLGEFPVENLTRAYLLPVLDAEMAGPGARNIFVAVLGALYKWGKDREITTLKPTEGIAKLKMGEHQPWPDAVLETALAADDELVRLTVNLLCFTGQRIGDVLKMRWSDIRKSIIHVVQQKTGKELWIPLLSELQAVLDETPKRGMTIIADKNGRPLSQGVVRTALQAFTAEQGHKTVPHGLRKNAVNAFLEAGCSIAEVASITGQGHQMVEHYAKRINQKHMAQSAVLKLENKRGAGKRDGKS